MAADALPAWSWHFTGEGLRPVESALPSGSITPAWAWANATGAGVKVAVVDSGVEAEHPAVGGRLKGYAALTLADGKVTVDTSPHEDAFGHGTACAGIIASIAPEAELYSVRVLGSGLTGQGDLLVKAVEWCIENGMQVCNLSLGTSKRELRTVLHDLADRAYFAGIALVTAANNLPIPTYPSLFSSVVSVAASEGGDPLRYYANPTPPVEFGAAGIDVRVPWKGGAWVKATGNSYAAPHISGMIARLLSAHPGLSVPELKTVLRALAANAGP